MKYASSRLYRIFVPKFIRKKILAKALPQAIKRYYSDHPQLATTEVKEVLNYLETNSMEILPYVFQNKYSEDQVDVFIDPNKNLPYVVQEGKRLYFKRRWSKRKIQKLYTTLIKEQDVESPHRYLSKEFIFDEGEVLIDAGAAEGNFALSVVEKADRIILFEPDKEWIEPLSATFEPWKDKISIVNKFVGDVSNENSIKLDDYFSSEEKISFIKIDIEGAELKLFRGAQRILSSNHDLKVAVCTYHKQNDEVDFKRELSNYGFQTSHSNGFMLFYYDKKISAPYLRRGLVRAEKLHI